MPDTIFHFIVIFTSLLVLTGIPVSIAGTRYFLTKRFLKHQLANKCCSICKVEYGSKISPIRPGYNPSTPPHERTYDYWIFRCVNCRAEVWVNTKAEIIKVYAKEEIGKQWEEIKKQLGGW
jgi:hypothetical protein